MLPIPPLGTSTVEIAGEQVPITSLSRDAVVSLTRFGDDTSAAEVYILSAGCGITEAEATAWRKAVDAPTAGKLLDAIAVVSGIRRASDPEA